MLKTRFNFEARWAELGERIGVTDWKSWKRTFDDMNAMYSESGRHYHTISHIKDCLEKVKLGKDIATDLDAVEAAVWFHDAFYDTKRHDNEERSAAFAEERLVRAGVGRAFAENVERMILFTIHRERPTDVDAQLVVYDALTHAFWYDPRLPEAIEANHIMADFFVKQLGK